MDRLLRARGSSSTMAVRIFPETRHRLLLEWHRHGYFYSVRFVVLHVQLEAFSVEALQTGFQFEIPMPERTLSQRTAGPSL